MRRRWLVPTLVTLVLVGYVGWIVVKGLGPGDHPFFATEVAPGIFGTVLEPPAGTPAASGTIVLPRTAGWDRDQAASAAALAAGGSVVVVLDYYRGGRDSYHGTPNEVSDQLWGRWRANLAAGLAWVDAHRRGLTWTLVAPAGRAADLVRDLSPVAFPIRGAP